MTKEQAGIVRANRHLTCDELARLLGVHRATAARWKKAVPEGEEILVDGQTREVEGRILPRSQTPEELMDEFGVDRDLWEPTHAKINRWEQGAKLPDGTLVHQPLYQTKVSLRRIPGAAPLKKVWEKILERLEREAPVYRPVSRRTSDRVPVALEISLPDYHLGKLAPDRTWHGPKDFKEALAALVEEATAAYQVVQIVFPIGNDFLHIDTPGRTTTRGTPMPVSGEWEELYLDGFDLLVWAVEYLRQVAPVKVIPVGGNHDEASAFSLGVAVHAWFRNDPEVVVDLSPQGRKYWEWGSVLLGFTHGETEKAEDLPAIMAIEAPQAWGRTKFREFHRGHLHRKRNIKWVGTLENKGVIVRELGSLSPFDRWHIDHGFMDHRRTGEAFIWHKDRGLRAYFGYSL